MPESTSFPLCSGRMIPHPPCPLYPLYRIFSICAKFLIHIQALMHAHPSPSRIIHNRFYTYTQMGISSRLFVDNSVNFMLFRGKICFLPTTLSTYALFAPVRLWINILSVSVLSTAYPRFLWVSMISISFFSVIPYNESNSIPRRSPLL